MPDPALMLLLIALTGLVAGLLGGLLGVGGSTIMIPALVMLYGQDLQPGYNQHLYQAAAMLVNVAVAVPSVMRHRKANAIRPKVLLRMLPAALVCILIGVGLSNQFEDPVWLGRLLVPLLIYVIYVNLRKLFPGKQATAAQAAEEHEPKQVSMPRATGIGATMGLVAGLMGIGGGAVAVPLQQLLLKFPLRVCIANSAALICITAGVGAIAKNATLPEGIELSTSLTVAGLLAPTAIIGAYIGAHLTHTLPVRWVRMAFVLLMVVAAWKMASIPL